MRLSEWRKSAPNEEAASASVMAAIVPVAVALRADADPHCWVLWGDDPLLRYTVLAPTRGGLAIRAAAASTQLPAAAGERGGAGTA